MAFFGVTVETIEKVWPHPDAERLDLAKCQGMSFQFVVPKGQYSRGDQVLYFPLDSMLPPELVSALNMTGKFGGQDKNIIKTVRLRGQISQGFVVKPDGILPPEMLNSPSEEITRYFNVKKYSVDPVELRDAILNGLPSGYSTYDIEGADRNQEVVDLLLDQDVVVMEKMEGDNSSFGKVGSELFVNCRERSIVEKPGFENAFWKIARSEGLLDMMKSYPFDSAMLYAEVCGPGIHGNHYKLKEKRVYLFDIRAAGEWLCFLEFENFLAAQGKEGLMAPILYKGRLRDFLAGRTIQEASNGPSLIDGSLLREGIVVKPLKEQQHPKLGRLIIKQRSPQYLAKTGR